MSSSGRKFTSSRIDPAPYQLIPLLKLLSSGLGSVLVADGVGAGKTISAGYILRYFSEMEQRPGMVVAPPGLVDKWQLELSQKFKMKAASLRSPEHVEVAVAELESTSAWTQPSVYILSNSLLRVQELSGVVGLSSLVFDEIHNYRNRLTMGYRGALSLSSLIERRAGLSATPINNSLEDLSSELSILLPQYPWDSVNAVVEETWNLEKEALTDGLTTRFTKDRLGIHFARRRVEEHRVAYSSWYYDWVNSQIALRHDASHAQGMSFDNITLYRLAASSPRAFSKAIGQDLPVKEEDAKLLALQNVLDRMEEKHVIVFCAFKETVEQLAGMILRRPVYQMTGDTPVYERGSVIEQFRESRNGVLVLTSVGSEGLDLQFADTVVNYDLHWNPMVIEQRIGRVDRIGQKKPTIGILNMVIIGSIDDRVIEVLHDKLRLISGSMFEPDRVLGSQEPPRRFLVDQESLKKEVSAGEGLVTALDWVRTIPTSDYEVLSSVDVSYCGLDGVSRAGRDALGPHSMLTSGPESNRWLSKIQKSIARVKELLSFYS